MARSLKKGPFADESLLKKVDAMNASGDKSVILSIFSGRILFCYREESAIRGKN